MPEISSICFIYREGYEHAWCCHIGKPALWVLFCFLLWNLRAAHGHLSIFFSSSSSHIFVFTLHCTHISSSNINYKGWYMNPKTTVSEEWLLLSLKRTRGNKMEWIWTWWKSISLFERGKMQTVCKLGKQ